MDLLSDSDEEEKQKDFSNPMVFIKQDQVEPFIPRKSVNVPSTSTCKPTSKANPTCKPISEAKLDSSFSLSPSLNPMASMEKEDLMNQSQLKECSEEHVDFFLDNEIWPNVQHLSKTSMKEEPVDLILSDEKQVILYGRINQYLREYQRQGVQWLYEAFSKNKGCILGDEMGLGKTIQIIALICALFNKKATLQDKQEWQQRKNLPFELRSRHPLTLIVAPASLLQYWADEIIRWCFFSVCLLTGDEKSRQEKLELIEMFDYEIVISSYEIFQSHSRFIGKLSWTLCVFDEVHRMKNDKSLVAEACRQVHCLRKIGLTGTLMQNSHKDIYNLLHLMVPGSLGTREHFGEYYSIPIKRSRQISATQEARKLGKLRQKELSTVIEKHYLHRAKSVVKDLQGITKNDTVVFCNLTPYQLAAYQRVLASPDFQLVRKQHELCDCGRTSGLTRSQCCYRVPRDGEEAILWQSLHPENKECKKCPSCLDFTCQSVLLKLANHLDLLKVCRSDSKLVQKKGKQLARLVFGEDLEALGGLYQAQQFTEVTRTDTCGKLVVLQKLLANWYLNKDKVLIFSRSTRMLDILQQFILHEGYENLRYDGKTPPSQRTTILENFRKNPTIFVLLISIKAGSLGLNITSARNVVIFDPSWNPSDDLQAQDRVYRIGQVQNVSVFRLITLGTIEELIYLRQIYKQQLSDTTLEGKELIRYFEAVQEEKDEKGELFGIANLLQFKEEGILKDIRERNSKILKLKRKDSFAVVDHNQSQENSKINDPDDKRQFLDLGNNDQQRIDQLQLVGKDTSRNTQKYKNMKNRKNMKNMKNRKNMNKVVDEGIKQILVDAGVTPALHDTVLDGRMNHFQNFQRKRRHVKNSSYTNKNNTTTSDASSFASSFERVKKRQQDKKETEMNQEEKDPTTFYRPMYLFSSNQK